LLVLCNPGVKLQNSCEQFIMLADTQALTDNADNPGKIKKAILQVAIDYLSVGIDPKKQRFLSNQQFQNLPN